MPVIPILGTNKTMGGTDVFVIAEIGKNFIQTKEEQPMAVYLQNAKDLIDAAVAAGVDAVKFQTHNVEDEQLNIDVTSPHFTGSDRYNWVSRNTNATPLSFWQELKKYCDEKGVIFFSTPMSRGSAQKLDKVGVPFWKIGSGDVQDFVLLDYVCQTGKPVIIATGMVGLAELKDVVRFVNARTDKLVILYCISKYPCPAEEFNLGTIEYFREQYPHAVIGFSDHSIGYEVDLAAVKIGAQVIEKHFSFSRDLWGADHKVSMTPEEMTAMVKAFKTGEYQSIDAAQFYGEKNKELEGAHNQFRPIFNKSLVAGCDIPAGTAITKEMVYAMRPQMYCQGLHAERYEEVLGKPVKKDIKKFEPLNELTVEV